MTAVSVPRNSTALADADLAVEVSLVPDSAVASLALPLLAATRAAALACLPWVGRDQPKAADGAAVAAMRASLAHLPGRATVVIGEGEKDDAPMLFAGEDLLATAGHPRLLVESLASACSQDSTDASTVACS